MDKLKAQKILSDNVISLLKNNVGGITTQQLEREVIFTTCLEVLKAEKEANGKRNGMNALFGYLLYEEVSLSNQYTELFVSAALEIYPDHYGEAEAASAMIGIPSNCAWDGMWDHLRKYYKNDHNRNIDNVEINDVVFYSNSHSRFVNDNFGGKADVPRVINLTQLDGFKEIMVKIEPSLSPKKAILIEDGDSVKKYRGTDPDFGFDFYFDEDGDIEKLVLNRFDSGVRIEFVE